MYVRYNYKNRKKDSEVLEHELNKLKKRYVDLKKEELLNLCAILIKYVGALEEQNSLLNKESSLLRSLSENKARKTDWLFPVVKNTSQKPLRKPSIIIQMPVVKNSFNHL